MDGVILFADDQVFNTKSNEYKLFCKFNSDSELSVLPIDNLYSLEKVLSSVSTYRALVLDWNFKHPKDDSDDDDIQLPDETPFELIKNNLIYSLIYIYSQNPIGDDTQKKLRESYHEKIFFATKDNSQDVDAEYQKILDGIQNSENSNKHMEVPFVWSQTINKSTQQIFSELEKADPNWIKEIYDTAKDDGTDPNFEVINLFHNLLNELIVQNDTLTNSLSKYTISNNNVVADKEEALSKLYHRIYYTKLLSGAPLMTGDIFRFAENEYGILLTPECNMNSKKDDALDFLTFNRIDFESFLTKKQYSRDKYQDMFTKDKQKKELLSQFNNGNIGYHILPSFPFEDNTYNISAYIDFKKAFIVKQKSDFENKRTNFKLNSPYIYQLRQRYLAYAGRVGVPAIPPSLGLFNLR